VRRSFISPPVIYDPGDPLADKPLITKHSLLAALPGSSNYIDMRHGGVSAPTTSEQAPRSFRN
jgi:hypothetical protein